MDGTFLEGGAGVEPAVSCCAIGVFSRNTSRPDMEPVSRLQCAITLPRTPGQSYSVIGEAGFEPAFSWRIMRANAPAKEVQRLPGPRYVLT